MKVKAKKLVFYGNRRYREGEVFELVFRKGINAKGEPIELTPEQQFSEKAMEKLEEPARVTPSKKKAE